MTPWPNNSERKAVVDREREKTRKRLENLGKKPSEVERRPLEEENKND